MCSEACTIVRAVAADFFFDCEDVEIPTNESIRNIPWDVHYHEQGLRLESFEDFNVGGGGRAPELYAVGPERLEYVCKDASVKFSLYELFGTLSRFKRPLPRYVIIRHQSLRQRK
jgi:hypothetical protein